MYMQAWNIYSKPKPSSHKWTAINVETDHHWQAAFTGQWGRV